jgi:hypothetical protein
MRRISSKTTFLYKRIFPIFWFGIITLIFISAVLLGVAGGQTVPVQVLIIPLVMAGFGYFFMKRFLFDLVDEVWDDGAQLVVRNRGQEDRIALSDIMNVSYSPLVNPPRVTLMLRKPSIFGTEVSFSAPARFIPFAASPVIEALIRRVDAARGGAGRIAAE